MPILFVPKSEFAIPTANAQCMFVSVWNACAVRCEYGESNRINYESFKQDALYRLIYYSKSALHVSGDVFAHQQEHVTVFAVSGSIHPRCFRLVPWMIWNWPMWVVRRVYTPHNPHSSVSTYPRHQPAATWENTTRYSKYSQVLLMMGENIARNM